MTNKLWAGSKFDSLVYDDSAVHVDHPCCIRTGDGSIEVTYEEGNDTVCYRGVEVGSGHFQLRGIDVEGQATLHMFEGARVLDGYWVEGSVRGMWRIYLS